MLAFLIDPSITVYVGIGAKQMAKTIYFSDINANTVELNCVFGMDNAKFAVAFPGIKGRRYDSFSRMVGCVAGCSRVELPVTRAVEL